MATEAIYNKAKTGLPFSMAVSTLHPSPEPKVNPERAEKRLEPQGGLGTGETLGPRQRRRERTGVPGLNEAGQEPENQSHRGGRGWAWGCHRQGGRKRGGQPRRRPSVERNGAESCIVGHPPPQSGPPTHKHMCTHRHTPSQAPGVLIRPFGDVLPSHLHRTPLHLGTRGRGSSVVSVHLHLLRQQFGNFRVVGPHGALDGNSDSCPPPTLRF